MEMERLVQQLRQAHIRVLRVGLVVGFSLGFLLGLTVGQLVWR